jgi:Zn-dependent peptidase ImmA (M78 family)
MLARSGSPRLANKIAIDVRFIVEQYCNLQIAVIPHLNLGKPVLGAFIPEYNLIMIEYHCIPTRQRFSLAHELGHAQLEDDFGDCEPLFTVRPRNMFRCDESDIRLKTLPGQERGLKRRAEIRANQFAAALLMPAPLVREVWRDFRNEADCAIALSVSRQAIRYRLEEMGLAIRREDSAAVLRIDDLG